jgi:hypothetical protein
MHTTPIISPQFAAQEAIEGGQRNETSDNSDWPNGGGRQSSCEINRASEVTDQQINAYCQCLVWQRKSLLMKLCMPIETTRHRSRFGKKSIKWHRPVAALPLGDSDRQ